MTQRWKTALCVLALAAALLAAWVQEITWTGPSGAETPVIIADSLWIRVLDR